MRRFGLRSKKMLVNNIVYILYDMPALSLAFLRPLADKIAALPCDRLARASGFLRRAPRKINPAGFLLSACLFALQGSSSLAAFAQLWAVLHQQTLSKQAVHKRCSAAAVAFLQAVLESVVASLARAPALPGSTAGLFGRVLVQDSTALALPKKLAALFPGPSNQNSQNQACLKVQATLDLLQNQWVQFHLSPFTCNDQAASPQILEGLQKRDLVIRDLGYLVLKVLRQIDQSGAYFLSRCRYGLQVRLPGDRKKNSLLKIIKSSALWDGWVALGQEEVPVRLVAMRLSAQAAAERRRKARANRDRRLRHRPEYFELLGWNIFITNIPPQTLGPEALVKLYELRWRIEIIFKAWKSHFKIDQLTEGSTEQVLIIVLGKLIWISWFSIQFAQILARTANLSILKLAGWFSRFALLFLPNRPRARPWGELIDYYCRYEKRKNRRNYLEKCICLS